MSTLGEFVRFRNGRTSPVRTDYGKFAVYGSNGVIGYADVINVDVPSVVIGRVGSYCGSTYFAPQPCWVTDNAIVATPVQEDEARFWFYVLSNSKLNELRHGSGQPLLNQSILTAIKFQPPPRTERLAIAATLGALDDRLESNTKIIELVPEVIRAIVSASLGEGTRAVAVADLAEFVNGGAYTKGASANGRIVIRIAELNSGPSDSTVYNDIEVPEDKTARPGDILMSWSGSLGVYRWALGEAIVNQHIFKVIPTQDYPAWLVFDRLDEVMTIFRGIAKDKATTMGHIQRGHLSSTTVDVPPPELIKELDIQIAPLWDRLLMSEQENLLLADLRDALLPALLSGRVRVPEAEGPMAGLGA